jgi:hypothetical protein
MAGKDFLTDRAAAAALRNVGATEAADALDKVKDLGIGDPVDAPPVSAADEATAVAEEEPEKVRLAQQCMLTAVMMRLADMNSVLDYNKWMLHLKGNPDFLVNKLTKKCGEEEFAKICPEQLAELVPYVRIYKVIRESASGPVEKQIELAFNSGVEDRELDFTDAYNRGKGVGLKSVDWTFDGSDPYTASRSIQVNLNFFFQSFEELIRPRTDAKGSTYRYLDLILMADCRGAKSEEPSPEDCPKPEPSKTFAREFYPECHEIKLDVGWSDPGASSFVSTTPNGQEILENIECSRTSLWLTLIDHNFEIGQDGTFSLQVNYMGRITGLTADPRANVFIDPKNIEIMSAISNLKAEIDAAKCDKELLQKKKKQLGLTLKNQRQALVSSIVNELAYKNYLATIQIPTKSYITLVNAINKGNLLTAGTVGAIEFSVAKGINDELQAQIDALQKAAENAPAGTMGGGGSGGGGAGSSWGEDRSPATTNPDLATEGTFAGAGGQFGLVGAALYAASNMLKTPPPDAIDAMLRGTTYEDFYGEFVDFEYFYLGDLIEIITDRVMNSDVWSHSNSKAWRGVEFDNAVDKIRVVLGTLSYKFGADTGFQTMNLSDIPVSLALFLDWMKDNVIDSEREEYPFISFINDIMTNLVNVALGSNCFEGLLTQRVKVRKTFFSSAAAGGVEPFVASGGKSVADESLIEEQQAAVTRGAEDFFDELEGDTDPMTDPEDSLEAAFPMPTVDPFYFGVGGQLRNFRKIYDPAVVATKLQQGLSTVADHYHYILFYMENIATRENFKGNCANDTANGIHHMQLGRQCGLLKTASFKKTNQQYLREARFAQQTSEDYNPLAQLSNVYDVEFTMVGNNIWIPGKRIYFDPSSISPEGYGGGSYGLGKPHQLGSPAHLLGIGGYHIVTGVKSFIESGKFETVVTARWETGGGETVGIRDEELVPCPPPVECEKEED